MTTFGERLRTLRSQRGVSQAQLAGEDLSPSYVSLLESGKRQPSEEIVRLLAERLGCAVADLDTSEVADARRERAELDLAYARMAIDNADAASVIVRLEELRTADGTEPRIRDEAAVLLARACERADDLPRTVTILRSVYARALEHQTHLPIAVVGQMLCAAYVQSGDQQMAIEVGEESLAASDTLRLRGSTEYLHLAATLIWAYFERGDLAHAGAMAGEFAELAAEYGTPTAQGEILWNAALVAEAMGQLGEAVRLCTKAQALMGEQGSSRDLVRLRTTVAWMIMRADGSRAAEAATLLDAMTGELADLGGPYERALWGSNRALAHLLLGEGEDAERLARQALLHLSGQKLSETAWAVLTLGDALHAQGASAEAVMQWQAVGTILNDLPQARQLATIWRETGERFLRVGRSQEALDAFQKALDLAGVRAAMPVEVFLSRYRTPSLRV